MSEGTTFFERRLNVEYWDTNARSILKVDQIDSRVLEEARRLRREGALVECLDELAKDPAAENDPEAKITAGLAQAGLDRHDDALVSLAQAEKLLQQRLCDVHVNRVLPLLAKGDDDAAEAEIWAAIKINPKDLTVWVNLLAARRKRPESIEEVVNEMQRLWPEWSTSGSFKRYVFEDLMLRHVREHPKFNELFSELLETPNAADL